MDFALIQKDTYSIKDGTVFDCDRVKATHYPKAFLVMNVMRIKKQISSLWTDGWRDTRNIPLVTNLSDMAILPDACGMRKILSGLDVASPSVQH